MFKYNLVHVNSSLYKQVLQDVLWFLESCCKIAAPESVVKDINQTINCYQPQYCQHVENKERRNLTVSTFLTVSINWLKCNTQLVKKLRNYSNYALETLSNC